MRPKSIRCCFQTACLALAVGPAWGQLVQPRSALGDKDVRSPVTNPRYSSYAAQCDNEPQPLGKPPEIAAQESVKQSRPRVVWHEGASKTMADINQRRFDDARDPAVGGTFNDPKIRSGEMHILRFDTDQAVLRGLWLPRHGAPPYFKVYETPLDGLKEIHLYATSDPFQLLVLGYAPGYSNAYRMQVGPYCYKSNRPNSQ